MMNTIEAPSLFSFDPSADRFDAPQKQVEDEVSILVVDDNAVSQLVVLQQLRALNCAAVTVSSGAAAIEVIKSAEFDLILLDCRMPDIDGYATARMIRTLEASRARPRSAIVAITGDPDIDCVDKCLSAGMDGHLAKPTNAATLRTIVERFIA